MAYYLLSKISSYTCQCSSEMVYLSKNSTCAAEEWDFPTLSRCLGICSWLLRTLGVPVLVPSTLRLGPARHGREA